MKKKLTLIITCVALVSAIAVGGTLAWFTNEKKVTNVVTLGNVSISLTETGLEQGQQTKDYGIVMPGDKIKKDSTITNTSKTNSCYIRVSAPVEITSPVQPKVSISLTDLGIRLNDNWVLIGDYYYYTEKLAPGAYASPFKAQDSDGNTVFIPKNWGNAYAGVKFQIPVTAQAIQADNFTPDYTSAKPWSDVSIEAA